ncbi:hypothetical protein BCR35DRAFT_278105 [Leucosporidium creatinivorum]|uniref:Enoyl reductase (ER) domain-containing protein n=1 Tax=Leucosporidium creatinivorum TaxID=106004 RepID=A0A1Y2FM93_9BASI|nr:hypothetical protein BCR35DRAFT_278105 [Leucosporidium creatinivorum]
MKGYYIERNLSGMNELPATLKSDVPDPKPGKGEVLVDVHTAGFNYFDVLQVQGLYQHKPPFPYVAGAEFSGTISPSSPIPAGAPSWLRPGARVFGAGQGSYAEKIKVPFHTLVPVPEGMKMEEAAGLYVTYPTSYAALVYRANIQPGEYLLIHAAAGGVGLAALQIGKALGAKVIAACSTQAKLDVCLRYGADYAINYAEGAKGDWQKKVMEITKGHGADVVYDPVGMIVPSLKCIAWNGRLIVVGFAGGNIEKIPANLILLKNVAVTGVHWGAYSKNEIKKVPETWEALLKLFAEKRIKGVVYDKVFEGLESVPEGLRALGARETWGKAVVRVSKESAKL